jgi:hypothetical protein
MNTIPSVGFFLVGRLRNGSNPTRLRRVVVVVVVVVVAGSSLGVELFLNVPTLR